jgi:type IV secretory pathway VirB3-like protein
MERLDSSDVNTAILHPMTTLGVDDWLFTFNVLQCMYIGVATRWSGWLIVSVVFHFLLMLVTKLKPNLIDCYMKYSRQANRYDPYPSINQRRGLRPVGFGRGVLR